MAVLVNPNLSAGQSSSPKKLLVYSTWSPAFSPAFAAFPPLSTAVMTTPPACFCPSVRPKGLSTSTSMFFEAVLALISSPPLPFLLTARLLLFVTTMENTLLASDSDSPWKEVFCTRVV
eukprot:TRINITY_DN28683_c0_g1_i3.p2 TRINITY_DN28683_c0_g1~~TRINITY_DN28683_c0_g1_i3.p2  ORF type:complete len:119 (+),score=20.32 TRINITY_DN28683_c0_g1_i3:1228-1584(+)